MPRELEHNQAPGAVLPWVNGRATPAPPLSWNILATAKDHQQRHLARRLTRFGDFHWTAYRGLLVGRVEDQPAFFAQLLRCEEDEPGFLAPVARIVPISRTIGFTPENLLCQLKEIVLGWAGRIDSRTFYVRCERRGQAGVLHSHDLEQALEAVLRRYLQAQGHQPRVDFKDPELIIAVELIDNVCGVGLITKALRAQYPFVRVP